MFLEKAELVIIFWLSKEDLLLTVGRFYVGNDVTRSTLLDRACACSYENLPKYRSYRVSNTAPWCLQFATSVKSIKNKASVNQVVSGETMLRRYRSEIESLKKQLQQVSPRFI